MRVFVRIYKENNNAQNSLDHSNKSYGDVVNFDLVINRHVHPSGLRVCSQSFGEVHVFRVHDFFEIILRIYQALRILQILYSPTLKLPFHWSSRLNCCA